MAMRKVGAMRLEKIRIEIRPLLILESGSRDRSSNLAL